MNRIFKNTIFSIKKIAILLALGLIVSIYLNYHKNAQIKSLSKEKENTEEYNNKLLEAINLLFSENKEHAILLFKQLSQNYESDFNLQYLATDYISKNDTLLNTYLRIEKENEKIKLFLNKEKHSREIQNKKIFDITNHLDSLQNELLKADSLNAELVTNYQKLLTEYNEIKNLYGKIDFINSNNVSIHYLGELKNGMANGFGMGVFDSKGIYEGYWKDNNRHGKGKYLWANGDIYEGMYKQDKRNGLGIYYFSTGEKYEGNWENDLRNGKGAFYGKDGKIILEGTWINDKLNKNGENQLIEEHEQENTIK